MIEPRSGVVEVYFKPNGDLKGRKPCEIIYELIHTPEIKHVKYQKPRECYAPDVEFDREFSEKSKSHHVFVQVTLKNGNFGDYAQSLRASIVDHGSVSAAVWKNRQTLVAGGVARVGTVCFGDQVLKVNE